MKNIIKEIVSKHREQFSGSFLMANREGIVYSQSCGYANRDFRICNTLDTKFDTASITKAFTAAAILKLAEQNLLSLDEKITQLVDLSGTRISENVTINHLLTHTSGIADDADEESGEDYSALFVDKPNYSVRCCKDFLPQFAYKEPYFAPGENVRYNNCAFILLGLAIESITGKDCREYIRDAVFTPCGMNSTKFCSKDEIEENRAEGYFAVRDDTGKIISWKKNIYSYPPIGTPDGGAYTTVGDLERFMRCITDGKLLSPHYTEQLITPHSCFTRENKHGIWQTGYAFEFISRNDEIICMYKEGGNTGVDGITAYFPTHDISVHILSNQDGSLWNIFEEIKDVLLS